MALDVEQIAETFERCFSERGWEATSVQHVAEALGASKEDIYSRLHPESEGYEADLSRFRDEICSTRAGLSCRPEQLFDERVKTGVGDFLRRRRARECYGTLMRGLDLRDDSYERLLYLIHGSFTVGRLYRDTDWASRGEHSLTEEFAGFLPTLVKQTLEHGVQSCDFSRIDVADTTNRVTQMLRWSMDLVESESLDLHAACQLQQEITDGVLEALVRV